MIGKLRDRIDILEPVRTADSGGGVEVGWSVLESAWAELRSVNSAAEGEATRDSFLKRYRVRLRYRDDLTAGHRIRFDTEDYEITSVRREDARERYMRLDIREIRP